VFQEGSQVPESRSDDPMPAWLEALYQRQPALDVSSLDLCFLVSLQRRAQEQSLAAFSEQQLLDTFAAVCALVAPETEQVAARATHSLRRLREQRLLVRVDGAGISRAGEYALSRLGGGIAEFYVEEEALSPENLELLAHSLLASLNEVRARAQRAKRAPDWQTAVVGPLRITAGELILGIERRQRGLDLRQEEFQREISHWLETDWFGAIDRCRELLDGTAATLRQLHELLLRYTQQFQEVLQDILELACTAEQTVAEGVVHRVMGQIDRIAAWGALRHVAWSEYYDHVHRYLRDVVRLDPERALTQRLREQLSGHGAQSFSLTVADAPALRVLRTVVPPPPPAPVRRPRGERKPQLEEAPAAAQVDPLSVRVQELLAERALAVGSWELSELTAKATEDLPAESQYASAGKVAELAAKHSTPALTRQRPWVPVRDGLVIEDWQLGQTPSERSEP
jgi:chromosome partition protein MukF